MEKSVVLGILVIINIFLVIAILRKRKEVAKARLEWVSEREKWRWKADILGEIAHLSMEEPYFLPDCIEDELNGSDYCNSILRMAMVKRFYDGMNNYPKSYKKLLRFVDYMISVCDFDGLQKSLILEWVKEAFIEIPVNSKISILLTLLHYENADSFETKAGMVNLFANSIKEEEKEIIIKELSKKEKDYFGELLISQLEK